MTATMVWDHLKRAMAARELHLTFAGPDYALADAIGNPDLIVACTVRETEAALSTLDLSPIEDGAVLPILHRRGKPDTELTLRLYGLGHRPVEVVGENLAQLDDDLAGAVNWALEEIASLQEHARSKQDDSRPRWPIIVLHTPEAWDAA